MESNPVIDLFLALGIIIASARVAGSVSRRLGQPRVFGELLAGVILGPTLLDLLHWPVFGSAHLGESIHEFAEFGVLLLMFNVGLDIHLNELIQVGRVGVLGGVLGALVPFALTVPVILVFGFPIEVAVFASITLAATSVSISAQTMYELGVLKTREGYALLAMALVDDVLAILMISLAVALYNSGAVQAGELIGIVAQMIIYFVVAGLVAWFILPRFFNLLTRFQDSQQAFGRASFVLVFALLFGWSADYLGGVAAITGAFIAGAGMSRLEHSLKERIQQYLGAISYVLLMPIFFVSVGLQTDLKQIFLTETGDFTLLAIPFAVALLAAAVITKVGGAYGGAKLGGFTNTQALRVGVSMISRGEVGLIIASIGLTRGIFDRSVFPALFLVILVTTVLTPPLVRLVFRQHESLQPADSG